MKYLFLLFILCISLAYSQKSNEHIKGKDFIVGKSYLIFQNDTYLYKKPSVDSKIVKPLLAGEKLEVEELTTVTSGSGTNLGIYLKVKTKDNKTGFVSSTDLSLGYFEAANGSFILYQKQKHVEETLLHFNTLSANGEVTFLGPFDFENLDFMLSLYDNRGLSRINHILTISYQTYDCDGPPSVKYLSLNLEENELLQVALLKNYCPDEKYSTLQKLIFPEESDGVENAIVYYSSKKKLLDKKNQEYKTHIFTRVYRWSSGSIMEPINEYQWSIF